jgi:hypothetical protein
LTPGITPNNEDYSHHFGGSNQPFVSLAEVHTRQAKNPSSHAGFSAIRIAATAYSTLMAMSSKALA